jgi:hypothetical protein
MEIAVVLSIIGLLIGAVIGGTALLKQSELQTVVADYTKFSASANQFRQQYGGHPGDILDATNFWGDSSADCADGAVIDGTPGTCNGNGDGDIADTDEPYRAWQQLVLAKYIEGNFTGKTGGGGTSHSVIGTNVPKSKIQAAGWSFWYKAATSADANLYDQDLSNFLAFGAAVTNSLTQAAAITPSDAWQVDTKVDNGLPGTGRVVSMKPAALANCASNPDSPTDTDDTNDTYNHTFKGAACGLNMSLTLK